MPPLLSICIPTYNRKASLENTLDSIIPQLTEDVELMVSDNASTDGTASYLSEISHRIQVYCQHENVGAEKNILTCLSLGSGQYIWLLNDDDAIAPNSVSVILSAIRQFSPIPLLWARAGNSHVGKSMSLETDCSSNWTEMNGDSFLSSIAEWITFCPSIVVRRGAVSIPSLKPYLGTQLIPTVLTLHAVAMENRVLVSDSQLIFPQEGEVGRYDVFTVFTHAIRAVCAPHEHRPFRPSSLEHVYKSCYIRVIGGRIHNWPLSLYSSWNLLRYGRKYRYFYTGYLPVIIGRLWRRTRFSLREPIPPLG